MTNDDDLLTDEMFEMFAEVRRALAAPDAFECLVDRLPGAIDAGCAADLIVGLKLWGALHGQYPVHRVVQALERHCGASARAPVENSGAPPTTTTSQHRDNTGDDHE